MTSQQNDAQELLYQLQSTLPQEGSWGVNQTFFLFYCCTTCWKSLAAFFSSRKQKKCFHLLILCSLPPVIEVPGVWEAHLTSSWTFSLLLLYLPGSFFLYKLKTDLLRFYKLKTDLLRSCPTQRPSSNATPAEKPFLIPTTWAASLPSLPSFNMTAFCKPLSFLYHIPSCFVGIIIDEGQSSFMENFECVGHHAKDLHFIVSFNMQTSITKSI